MWLLILLLATVVVCFWLAHILWRLHCTQLFADINQAYYVVLSQQCKHRLQSPRLWKRALRSPVVFGLVSSLMVMHMYGFHAVRHYQPLYEPLLSSDEFHLYSKSASLFVLVFKGMSRAYEYYQVLADDGLEQQTVGGDQRQVMRVFRSWWQHVQEWLAGPLGPALQQHLQQNGGHNKLWIVGFSRGGVYAEYMAYMLREWRQQIALCTLGKPMSGDRVWARTLDALYRAPDGEGPWGSNLRCSVIGDPIVNLPWASFGEKTQGWYPTQAKTALLLEHKETDYLWKYHALKTYYEALLHEDDEKNVSMLPLTGCEKCHVRAADVTAGEKVRGEEAPDAPPTR